MNVVVQELLEVRVQDVLVHVVEEGVRCAYISVRDFVVVSDRSIALFEIDISLTRSRTC